MAVRRNWSGQECAAAVDQAVVAAPGAGAGWNMNIE